MIPGLIEPKGTQGFSWQVVALPGGLALVILGLFIFAVPQDANKRVGTVETEAKAAAEAVGADGNLKTFPAGSVCAGDFGDPLKAQLNAAVAATGLKLESFNVNNTGQAAILQSYHVTIKGTGSYEAALSALNILHGYRPKIFADTVALHNHVNEVELEVQGRLFCR